MYVFASFKLMPFFVFFLTSSL